MSDGETLQFDDLNLKFGQIVQFHPNPEDGADRHDCLLMGCLPGESLIVTASPETGLFPQVQEGQQVIIRVMSSNGVALFPTTVLFISEMPLYMVYLDYPQAIKFRRVRNASRVDVALPVLVSNLHKRALAGIAGKISDISVGGARLELYDNAGEVGDEIVLKGKFQVGNIQRVLALRASIANKQRVSEKSFVYGTKFNEADEEKQLILFGYIFNSMAFGNVQTVS